MSTIEEVFLNLCEKEDNMFSEAENKMLPPSKKTKDALKKKNKANKKETSAVTFAKYPGKQGLNFFNWIRVWAIVADAFTFMNGKFWTIFAACILPTLQIFLFHFSIGKPMSTLPISVSTPENRSSRFSDTLIDSLMTRNIQVVSTSQLIDCHFVHQTDQFATTRKSTILH